MDHDDTASPPERKSYSRAYYESNKDRIRDYKRKWYAQNAARAKANAKRYYEANRERRKKRMLERYYERKREQQGEPRQRIRKLTPEDIERRIEAELARQERMRQERGRG